jgi:uncharacterized protein (DUF488 family)
MRSGQEQESLFPVEPVEAPAGSARTVFTIGHSTRSLEQLAGVLRHYGVERLVDIRHFPSSRHNPQFNKSELEIALPGYGIEYLTLEALGGYRTGGYRAHMATEEFRRGIEELERLAAEKPTAYMCAELKWWRCHRRHVSDVLAARHWRVVHLFDERRAEAHRPKDNVIKCD